MNFFLNLVIFNIIKLMKMSNKLPIFDLPTAVLSKIEQEVKKYIDNIIKINDAQIIAKRLTIELAEKEINKKYIGAGVPCGSS